jgi:alkyl sulfatase BDS1-like metallo-beta-lactamase superfamily hydrolase
MASIIELADRLWTGKDSTEDPQHHPFAALDAIEEITAGVGFYKGFVNLTVLRTEEGVVLIDTGSFLPAQHERSFAGVRSFASEPVHTAIYTHGHVDHAYGLPPFLREAESKGWGRPRVIGHRAVAPRMQRYTETAGYNGIINSRQFGQRIQWPTDPLPPTLAYSERLDVRVGEHELRLVHARGETDDHTWVFLPGSRVLCTGDLFIWAAPNAGNPQKVQRFAIEWATALRQMAALEPEILLPGHGLPVIGAARVREALLDTARYLESLYEQTRAAMNQGATLYEILEHVRPPAELAAKPFLKPVYDEPDFIVRNVYRCLGGWYSGVPSELKPAPRRQQAREIASLAGGVGRLLARARECAADGDLTIACHLVDWAAEAEPESGEVHQLRAEVYGRRAFAEPSTMSKGIFGAAARDSTERRSAGGA